MTEKARRLPRTYDTARSAFLRALENFQRTVRDSHSGLGPGCLTTHVKLSYETESTAEAAASLDHSERQEEPPLLTDVVFLKRPQHTGDHPRHSRNLCFVSSGVHGIEGYAGSALQTHLLNRPSLLLKALETSDVCLIHAVNPWGMFHYERTDEQNRDLNRNCHSDPLRFQQRNPFLSPLRRLTALQGPLTPSDDRPLVGRSSESRSISLSWASLGFCARAAALLIKNGVTKSSLAVMNGHHEHPREIFFGGFELSAHLKRLEAAIVDNLWITPEYARCVVLDIHTGLGPTAELTLLIPDDLPTTLAHWQSLSALWKLSPENRTFPITPGIFSDWLCEILKPNQRNSHIPVVFEIGTLGQGGLWARLESLRRMVEANQLRHFGTTGDRHAEAVRRRFRELFLPEDRAWEEKVLNERSHDLENLLLHLAQGPTTKTRGASHDEN